MRALLSDLRALERMLAEGMFERGVARIGSEQEMFLVDRSFHAAPAALQVLQRLDDPHYTTELGLFNLELNADPQPFAGKGLAQMEAQLNELYAKVQRISAELEVQPVLTGILPTLGKTDLEHREHGAEPALPHAEPRDDGGARRGLRHLDQGPRRARRQARLAHVRGVQRELPGPPPGRRAGSLRARVRHRAAPARAGARGRDELADALRQAPLGRDSHRALRAVVRHPHAVAARARSRGARLVRQGLGQAAASSRSSRTTSRASVRSSAPSTRRTRTPCSTAERSRS